MVVHEWWGLNDYPKKRAEQLAGLGYVALAADIYGDGQVATTPADAGKLAGKFKADRDPAARKRAGRGGDAQEGQAGVDPTRTACIGYCFGGTTALELARSGGDVKGVRASFHGGLDAAPGEGDAPKIRGQGVLVFSAGPTTRWPGRPWCRPSRKRCARPAPDWQFVAYGGAVHGFTNPAAEQGGHGPGEIQRQRADHHRSWEAMVSFFHEIFGDNK